jgi:hypothetical protein
MKYILMVLPRLTDHERGGYINVSDKIHDWNLYSTDWQIVRGAFAVRLIAVAK